MLRRTTSRSSPTRAPHRCGPAQRHPVDPPIDPQVLRDYAQLGEVVPITPGWLKRYTAAVVGLDAFSALVAIVVAWQLPLSADRQQVDPRMIALAPLAWVAALAMGRTYEHRFVGNGSEEYKRLFHASVDHARRGRHLRVRERQ